MTLNICNLDVSKTRFGSIAREIKDHMAAAENAAGSNESSDLVFLLTKRGAPVPAVEESGVERDLVESIDRALADAPDPARIVLLDCVDVAERRAAPDFAKIQFILDRVAARKGSDAAIAVMAVRYTWENADIYGSGKLDSFAVLPVAEAFTTQEILTFFNEMLDEAQTDISVAAMMGQSEEADAVIAEVLMDCVSNIGITTEVADEIVARLPEVLGTQSASGASLR